MLPSCQEASVGPLLGNRRVLSLSGKRCNVGKKTIPQTDGSEEVRIHVIGMIFDLSAGPHWFRSWRVPAK